MNCLRTRDEHVEFEFIEPTAPTYYDRQPPYNPGYTCRYYDNGSVNTDWRLFCNQQHVQSICTTHELRLRDENNEVTWARESRPRRRSIYEGVHWIPVSLNASA